MLLARGTANTSRSAAHWTEQTGALQLLVLGNRQGFLSCSRSSLPLYLCLFFLAVFWPVLIALNVRIQQYIFKIPFGCFTLQICSEQVNKWFVVLGPSCRQAKFSRDDVKCLTSSREKIRPGKLGQGKTGLDWGKKKNIYIFFQLQFHKDRNPVLNGWSIPLRWTWKLCLLGQKISNA